MTWAARRAALITVTGLLAASAMAIAPASALTGEFPAAGHTATATGRQDGRPGPAVTGRPLMRHEATAPGRQDGRPGRAVTGRPLMRHEVTGHQAAVTAGQQARVRRYWTRARMEQAVPLRRAGSAIVPGAARRGSPARSWLRAPVTGSHRAAGSQATPAAAGHGLAVPAQAPLRAAAQQPFDAVTAGQPWSGGGAVGRTTGKVFFTMGGEDYVCSGSTVASADADVVVTAAHCVKNGTGGWATNWTFVPGYANGNDPYGSFTASQFYVASQWSSQADNDYDVAFVRLNPASEGASQVPVVAEVGGQGIEFGSQPAQEVAFGYPAEPPYNGQQLYYCGGTVSPDPYRETDDNGLTCALTAGSSGGPWLSSFNTAAGTGIITAVSSFKYSNNDQILYGARLGPVAQELYEAAQDG